MINIDVICVGKLKNDKLKSVEKALIKKIKGTYKLNIIEVEDEKNFNIDRPSEVEKIKLIEGKKIKSKIKKGSFVITFEIEAKNMQNFYLKDIVKEAHNNNITIIIGGSVGLSKEISDISNKKISISKMTFPHQLMRMVVIEQFTL